MDASLISQVRRFNRTVTQRVGALDDEFLARHRPLGQARLLWEIGPDGADVRALRARLDLDSGYLTGCSGRCRWTGWSTSTLEPGDRPGARGPPSHPPRGRAERAELDRRADDAAASILGPLGAGPSRTGWPARWPRSSGS